MVNQTKRMAYLNGASMSDIYADAFMLSKQKNKSVDFLGGCKGHALEQNHSPYCQ